MIKGYEHELGHFQLDIARSWFQRGEDVENIAAKFFFYYTAFNALFFHWRLVSGPKRRPAEHEQIEHLVRRLGGGPWGRLFREAPNAMRFFAEREPIQKMDERSNQDPRIGNPTLGETYRGVLRNSGASDLDRLVALSKILYLVRCNLSHGSKEVSGDDMAVIERATPLLRVLTEEAIQYTYLVLRGRQAGTTA